LKKEENKNQVLNKP
jgi:hypothetical protein